MAARIALELLAPARDAGIAINADLTLTRVANVFELGLQDETGAKAAVRLALREPHLLPASKLNALRGDGVAALEAARAAAFSARHGVKVVGAAYASHEALGELPLMITKHCVRWILSLCPKRAKGVTDVQGTVRAEPLTLRFDCKPGEMHVVGAMRKHVLKALRAEPVTFYKTRPAAERHV